MDTYIYYTRNLRACKRNHLSLSAFAGQLTQNFTMTIKPTSCHLLTLCCYVNLIVHMTYTFVYSETHAFLSIHAFL